MKYDVRFLKNIPGWKRETILLFYRFFNLIFFENKSLARKQIYLFMLYLFMYLLFTLSKKQSPRNFTSTLWNTLISIVFLHYASSAENLTLENIPLGATILSMKWSSHKNTKKLERNSRVGKLKRHLSSRCPCKAINAGRHISSLRLQL